MEDVMKVEDAPVEFRVIAAAARAARVKLKFVRMRDGREESDGGFHHPAVRRWPVERMSPSPYWGLGNFDDCVGAAAAGHVLWDLGMSLHLQGVGPDGDVPAWLGLLHEVAHAATAQGPYVGVEEEAAAWEWMVAVGIWGPVSQQARAVRSWQNDAGLPVGVLRIEMYHMCTVALNRSRRAVAAGRAVLGGSSDG